MTGFLSTDSTWFDATIFAAVVPGGQMLGQADVPANVSDLAARYVH
jgi:hypothetical protein